MAKNIEQLEEQHRIEDARLNRERAELDRQFAARERDIDRESQYREQFRQREGGQGHGDLEAAIEAKLIEAGRAMIDRYQENQARIEYNQKLAEMTEQRRVEDSQREAARREQYQELGVTVERLPADERNTSHQYVAEINGQRGEGSSMGEAARNAQIASREAQRDTAERQGITDAQRDYYKEQHLDRDR